MRTTNLTTLLLAMFLSLGASAQFDFGIKAGLNSANVDFSNVESTSNFETITSNSDFGWHAGVYARVKILGIYLQPEFLYSVINSEIEVNSNNHGNQTETFTLNRLDVPVILGVKIGPASVFGGPIMSYNLNNPSDILEVDYRDGTFGFQAGVGLTFGDLIIDVKYEGSMHNLTEQVVIDGQAYEADARTGLFIVSLGYNLF